MRPILSGILWSLLVPLLLAASAVAQTSTVGNLIPGVLNYGALNGTVIDLSSPANFAGDLNSATFDWSTEPCVKAAKIKFFRPAGDTLEFLTERGPFDVPANSRPTVALNPPVAVQAGDLIGAVKEVGSCGNLGGVTPGNAAGYLSFAGADVTGNVSRSSGVHVRNTTLGIFATGPSSESVSGTVVVVVSSPGVAPSLFKTGFQMNNSTALLQTGRLVFHLQGTSGSGADPSLSFSLAPGETRSFDNLLPDMGLTGPQIGSLDIVTPVGASAPVVAARVFNDGGAAGTTGFTMGAVSSEAILEAGDHGVLFTPPDISRFRMNIGVRSGASGAVMTVTRRNAAGTVVQTLMKSYPPNFFEQISGNAFLAGTPFGADDSITIQVTSGSATVYAATADNTTEDPSIGFATKAP